MLLHRLWLLLILYVAGVLALETGLHAIDHVSNQRPGRAVQRPGLPMIGLAREDHRIVLDLDAEPRGNGLGELALGAFGSHQATFHLDLHALGNRHGLLADA